MTWTWKKAVALALLASAVCARDGTSQTADAGNARVPANTAAETPAPPSAEAANAVGGQRPAGTAAAWSVLAWSKPAAGSTVNGQVDELLFHFSPPARLGEVTVSGPEGALPMMVTAVGEVEHYSLPLSGIGTGRYTVDWKASARGVDYRGSFSFEVR